VDCNFFQKYLPYLNLNKSLGAIFDLLRRPFYEAPTHQRVDDIGKSPKIIIFEKSKVCPNFI
jgi:hypothetical protein